MWVVYDSEAALYLTAVGGWSGCECKAAQYPTQADAEAVCLALGIDPSWVKSAG